MICVSVGEKSWKAAAEQACRYPFTEIRLDYLENITEEAVYSVFSSCRSDKIVTFRKKDSVPDNERIIMIKSALKAGASFADADINNSQDFISVVSEAASEAGAEMIISYHNFEKTPSLDEIAKIMNKASDLGADIIKIACRAETSEEAERLLSLPSDRNKIVIAGMGSMGGRIRALSHSAGSLFTYACPDNGKAVAPGQVPYSELLREQERLSNEW